jgi:hypothetical protein
MVVRAAGAALLVLLVVSGCGGDPQPKIAPPPSTSPSAPVSSSSSAPTRPSGPVEPTMPALAKQDSAAGAKAFVKYYWQVVNYALSTGEIERLHELTNPDCTPCQSGIRSIADVYDGSGSISGGVNTPEDLVADPDFVDGRRLFRVEMQVRNTREVIRQRGKRNQVFKPDEVEVAIGLALHAGEWRVEYIQ